MILGLVGVLAFVVVNALVLTWAERKVAGHMQRRIGPKEVGPYGLIQPFADMIKLLGKEILTPANVDKPIYYLAPVLIFVPVLVSCIVIPFDGFLQAKDINVGILVILAFSSLSVFSILLARMGLKQQIFPYRGGTKHCPECCLRDTAYTRAGACCVYDQFVVPERHCGSAKGILVYR